MCCVFDEAADSLGNEMDDSAMYGSHAAVNNHSMGNILASSVPFGYNVADSFAPVGHDRSEDMCDILQQIISISSQSLDEAQMRSVMDTCHDVNMLVTLGDILCKLSQMFQGNPAARCF